ncbi:MAG: hypothetical protein SGPRY_000500 [Prymnesium sp.]
MVERPSDRHCALIKRAVKEELLKPRYRSIGVGAVIEEVLTTQGLEAHICNNVYQQYLLEKENAQERARDAWVESTRGRSAIRGGEGATGTCSFTRRARELDIVIEMRKRWGSKLMHNLQKMMEETGQPLIRMRMDGDAERWRGKRMHKSKFVYESSDLMEALTQSRAQGSEHQRVASWGISPIRMRTPVLIQLRERFADLDVEERQTGVDDELRGWFDEVRLEEGQRILAQAYTPLLEQYAKRGVPAGLRARVWLGILRLSLGEREFKYFSGLQGEVTRVALLTDDLQKRDAASPELEEQYFVFVAMVEEILLCFSRDPQVYQEAPRPEHATLAAQCGDGAQVPFPPCGVPPFRGQSQYAFPLCFVYAQPQQIYFVFRALWLRYWHKLHSFNSEPGSLLTLCLLFEELMQDHLPEVCTHLMHVDVHPTSIALPWITSGFSAALPADQTLLLWDRILGFGSLELLPLTAVAIFAYRARLILKTNDGDRVERIMSNLTSVKVIPLLQLFLWDKEALLSR